MCGKSDYASGPITDDFITWMVHNVM